MKDVKSILAGLSYKFDGDFQKIFDAICHKQRIEETEVDAALSNITTPFITILDADYPEFFRNGVPKPPIVIYYKGDLEILTHTDPRNLVSFVGSRKSSHYGESVVRDIIKNLPKDIVIVSGLAKGIDATAHNAAIDYGLKTIAVLGCGIDYIYPKENEALYNRIIENGGLIISEYPNSVAPTPDKFCFRNRIVADIGSFLVIGEAYERSGTSITVNYALNAGKGIGCVPYPANVNSACNALIKDGAAMIENSDDLLLQLGRNIINDTKSKKTE